MAIDINKIQVKREYIFGITAEKFATRKYKMTITNTELKGTVIIQEAHTPRVNHQWGKQQNTYYLEGQKEPFEDPKTLIESLIK